MNFEKPRRFLAKFFSMLGFKNKKGFATLEDEYTPKYCMQLEAAYGDGLMSEGGINGLELMFDQIQLDGKKGTGYWFWLRWFSFLSG